MNDALGRPLKNLRLSVTDRCNLRCEYCMPEEDYVWLPREDLLQFEEISTLVDVFLELGVDRLRVTGVADSESWTPNETRGKLAVWVEGLPENADPGNVKVWLGDYRARVLWVGSGQVNAAVECPAGEYRLKIECGGVAAERGGMRVRESGSLA